MHGANHGLIQSKCLVETTTFIQFLLRTLTKLCSCLICKGGKDDLLRLYVTGVNLFGQDVGQRVCLAGSGTSIIISNILHCCELTK